jgi:hypothetical protein
LSYPSPTGTGWIGYYVQGSLTEEPFAGWQDLTQYDAAGEATAGRIRLTSTLPRAGKYEVGMSAPVNGHCSLRVTRVTASGVASGSWEMQNGSPTMDRTWRGVSYDTATGLFALYDVF